MKTVGTLHYNESMNNMNLNQSGVITTSARFLLAGDVLAGSGFVVESKACRGLRTPSGKVEVVGHYPGSPTKVYMFNGSTRMMVQRGA